MRKMTKILVALVMCLFAVQARADDYPSRPIRLVVPFDAGGSVDTIARVLAEKVRQELGQPVIVENRGGAGGIIAFQEVVNAKPDGYTIILGASSYTTIAALYNLSFDPVKDITPITLINHGPLIITVNAKSPVKNLANFVQALKANPHSMSFGAPGVGSASDFSAYRFEQASGTSMVHVPYKSDGLVLEALLSGEIQVAFASGPALVPMLTSGMLRAVAVTSPTPWPTLPNLPSITTVAPGSGYVAWHGVWGPAGMPPAVVAKLNKAFDDAVESPDVQKLFRTDLREPATSTPQEFGQVIVHDIAQWKAVAKQANLKLH